MTSNHQPMLLVDRAPPTALYPERLHGALTDLEQQGLSHIVSWQPHGRAFKVHKRDTFVDKILPRYGGARTVVYGTVAKSPVESYVKANLCDTLFSTHSWFRQSSFPSFQRQLNIYGFVRIASGPDKDGYYHDKFVRGQPSLAREIYRTAVKGQGPRKAAVFSNPPDLYAESRKARAPVSNAAQLPSAAVLADNTEPAQSRLRDAESLPREISFVTAPETRATCRPTGDANSVPHQVGAATLPATGLSLLEQCRQWQRDDAQTLAQSQRGTNDSLRLAAVGGPLHPDMTLLQPDPSLRQQSSLGPNLPEQYAGLAPLYGQTSIDSTAPATSNTLDVAMLLQEHAAVEQNQRASLIRRLQQQANFHAQQRNALERQALLMQLQQVHSSLSEHGLAGSGRQGQEQWTLGQRVNNSVASLAPLASTSTAPFEGLPRLSSHLGRSMLQPNLESTITGGISDNVPLLSQPFGALMSTGVPTIQQSGTPLPIGNADRNLADILALMSTSTIGNHHVGSPNASG